MVSVPLAPSDWRRRVANEPEIPVYNRYFEENPTNLETQVALLARPGLKRLVEVGSGPIRMLYSQPGSFEDAAFVVSGSELYRLDTDFDITLIGDGIEGQAIYHAPSMTATARIGSVPEYLYIADGTNLWIYSENGPAFGTLTASDIDDGDKVQIGSVYYQWTSGSVNTGTPDGTNANPWLVALGASLQEALDNLGMSINADGGPGVTYSEDLTENPDVVRVTTTATTLRIRARQMGLDGDTIATVVVTGGPDVAFGGATLNDGGDAAIWRVETPDNLGINSVAFIAGYVICVVSQGQGTNGRFYWIRPGESTINALDYATAERSPDPVISVRAVGDQFWLIGTNSTEVWYPTGQFDLPFLRTQGRVFDRGVWEGTDVQIKDSVILVDQDGVVLEIAGGGPRRISNNSIEERIRYAMNLESQED